MLFRKILRLEVNMPHRSVEFRRVFIDFRAWVAATVCSLMALDLADFRRVESVAEHIYVPHAVVKIDLLFE